MANDRGVGRDEDYSLPQFQGKNYLLLIGIDKYDKWQRLSNAVKDAKEFSQVLITQYQFEEDNVYAIFDGDATESKIYQAIRDMKRRLEPSDNLVVYYSGHGHFDSEFDEGFWIPVDAEPDKESSFISNANIVKRINALETQHTFLIVDSCFSGSLVVQKRNAFADEKFKSRRILASGRHETVSDGAQGENSPFAAGLLTMLRKNTQARLDSSSLIRYVKDYVYGKAQQHPVEGRIPNSADEGGDFVFHLRKDEESLWQDVMTANTVVEYRNYLAGFPEGKYVDAANRKINLLDEDEIWKTTKINDNESAYEEYIKRYTPTGKHLSEARNQLDKLKQNRQVRQQTRQEMAEKENKRESIRLQFESLVSVAETLYNDRQLEQAKNKYREALDVHLPGFVPTQQYIEDQINFCQTNLVFLRHYEHGKGAMDSDNYRLAIEYFQEALKIRNNAKVEELIRHCQLKLKSKKSGTSQGRGNSRNQRPAVNRSANRPAPKKRSAGFWILVVFGGFAALFVILGVIGIIVEGNDSTTFDSEPQYIDNVDPPVNETTTTDNIIKEDEVKYVAPPPPTTNQLILGIWTVNQVLVNGYDLVETYPLMAGLIGARYEFFPNNVVNEYSIEGNLSHAYSINGNAIYIASPGYGTGTITYIDQDELTVVLPFTANGVITHFTFIMAR